MQSKLRWTGAWLYLVLSNCGEVPPDEPAARTRRGSDSSHAVTSSDDVPSSPEDPGLVGEGPPDVDQAETAETSEAGEATHLTPGLASPSDSTSTSTSDGPATCGPSGFSSVAVQQSISCALRRDTVEAVCWGYGYERMKAPVGVAFSSLTVGTGHVCGIRKDNREVLCWGSNAFGEASPPSGVRFTSLAIGYDHSCGITEEGSALCWGANGTGQLDAPKDLTFISLSAGRYHSCGVCSDQRVHCWGANGGAYASQPSNLPLDMISYNPDTGEGCARRTDTRQQICWNVPCRGERDVPDGLRAESVSSGIYHSCAIRDGDQHLACWGELPNHPDPLPPIDVAFSSLSDGRCGLVAGTGQVRCFLNSTMNVPPDLRFSQISAEYDHLCGITAETGELRCFGRYNYFSEVAVPGGTAFEKLAIGSCGMRADDHTLQCWQGNTLLPEGIPFSSATISPSGGCGVRRDTGAWYCWDGLVPLSSAPSGVDPGSITASSGSACGIVTATQRAACWGANWYGEARPPADLRFTKLSMAGTNTCGLRADTSTVACWGTGFLPSADAPGDVVFSDVYVGGLGDTACGLRADTHEAVCWVSSDYELSHTLAPAGVAFSKLAIIDLGVCGLRTNDRKVQCWGRLSDYPWPDDEFLDITPAESGPQHICGLRASDRVEVCWGDITRGWNPS
jgi:hypothetical protein